MSFSLEICLIQFNHYLDPVCWNILLRKQYLFKPFWRCCGSGESWPSEAAQDPRVCQPRQDLRHHAGHGSHIYPPNYHGSSRHSPKPFSPPDPKPSHHLPHSAHRQPLYRVQSKPLLTDMLGFVYPKNNIFIALNSVNHLWTHVNK